MTIRAVYENGVFRPTDRVDLPEHTHVVFEPRPLPTQGDSTDPALKIREILSRRYDTDDPTLAERHNEHQP